MNSLDIQENKKKSFEIIGIFLQKIGASFEVVFVLLIWFFIFSNASILSDFTVQDMIAYLLVGNMIGLFTSYLLRKTVRFNIGSGDLKMFYYKPLAYIIRVFLRTLKKIIIPFFLSISLNIILVYFFVNNLYLNNDLNTILLIVTMMILAFFTELLLAFILDIYVFWSIESSGIAKMMSRLKKIFAGAYFPLSFLGVSFVTISMFFPFAYSFYVPTQLYLKKMTFQDGLIGLSVQLAWIAMLYFVIRISWNKKLKDTKNTIGRKKILE